MAEILKNNKYTDDYISILKSYHDAIQVMFTDLIHINYTPNFITFACKFPKGRSKTFLFVRFKKNFIEFHYSGQVTPLKKAEELNSELLEKLKGAFNSLSEKQIN